MVEHPDKPQPNIVYSENSPNYRMREEDFVSVPCVQSAYAGEPKLELRHLHRERYYWFRRNFLMRVDRRGDFIAVILDATADAMRPTLAPGDMCLINRREKFILKKNNYQLFLVNWGDPTWGTAVKRVSAYKQQLILSSDNHSPRYAPIPISIENRDVNQIIIGRVVWAGKILVDFGNSEGQ
jgi:hypothetical protein